MRWIVTLAVVLLLCPVAALAGPSGPAADERPGLEGGWRLAETARGAVPDERNLRAAHHLFPGGGWICVSWKAGKLHLIDGTWAQADGALVLKDANGPVEVMTWVPDEVVRRFLRDAATGDVDAGHRWTKGASVTGDVDHRGRLVLRGTGAADSPLGFERISDPDPAVLAGDWTGATKKSRTLSLRTDGSVETSRRVFGKPITVEGKWRIDRGRLSITPDAGGDPDVAGLVFLTAADAGGETDRLILLRPAMAAEVYERPAKKEPPPPVKAGVVGVWVARGEDGEAEIAFRADGTYSRELRAEGEVETSGGTWKAVGGALVVRDREEGPMRIAYEVIGGDVLKLVIDGEELILQRKGAEPPREDYPRALLGKWLARDATGEITLVLTAGRFDLKARNAMQSWHYAGGWKHREGMIAGTDDASGQPVNLPYRLVTATQLMVTLNGVQVILVKVG